MNAEWKEVAGWPYEVSSKGQVRNRSTMRILKPDTVKGGYLRVTLSAAGKTKRIFINRLVCGAFHGPAPGPHHQARHLDGKSEINTASNLAWGTRSENEQDKRLHGTYQSGEGNPFAKLTEAQVSNIREAHAANLAARKASGFSQVEHGYVQNLALTFSVSVSCIKFVISNRNWKSA